MFKKLPFKYRFKSFSKLIKTEIYPEAFFAYFHKLPSEIKVEWFRDDGMIVGKVIADHKEFMTQGVNANDFIQMVNESLITTFDIPDDYFDIILKARSYQPSPAEYTKLNDHNVQSSSLGFAKIDRKLVLA